MQGSDREMVCTQCGQAFKFSAGEQDFYQQNQLQEPRRCKGCRGARSSPRAAAPRDTPRDTPRGHGGRNDNPQRAAQPALTSHTHFGYPSGNNYGQGSRRREPAQGYRPAAADDPNGYRSPGFQDANAYKIDYAGLPKDDEADDQAAMLGNSKVTGFVRPLAQAPRPTRNGHPRGMNGRQPDRSGTDPDAYRSPGFAKPAGRSPTPRSAEPGAPEGQSPGALKGEGRKGRPQRPRFETVCVECGAPAVVPFQPAEDRPAFCKPCYQIKKPLLGLGPGKTLKTAVTEELSDPVSSPSEASEAERINAQSADVSA